MVPQMQLSGTKIQAEFKSTSVEVCAILCSYAEGYVCRSFDFFIDTLDCFLHEENAKYYATVELIQNPSCNHYSSKI